jgi:acyl-CoA thioesterase-1
MLTRPASLTKLRCTSSRRIIGASEGLELGSVMGGYRSCLQRWWRRIGCADVPKAYGQAVRLFNVASLGLVLAAGVAAAAAAPTRIVAYGDSLTAGYGLPVAEAFPARLEAALRAAGRDVTVVNAGVSGDTTAGGLARLDWTLADGPDAIILALGANDALRGIDPEATYANLDAILSRLGERRVPVLLAGMLAPPNLGRDYGDRFGAVFPRLAEKHGVSLYPFFLDGVAAEPALNQADGLHPNGAGVAVIVARITPQVLRLLDSIDQR